MKVALYTPWPNAWVPLYKAAFERRGQEFICTDKRVEGADIYIHGWADARHPVVPGAVNIMILRRYELYECSWTTLQLEHVNHFVCVNDFVAEFVREYMDKRDLKIPLSVIYNAVDPANWAFKERQAGKNIGMACHIHPKKNIPLALQILAELPEDYSLHIAGGNQDQWMVNYLDNFCAAVRRKCYVYGQLPYEEMDLWWEKMNICLSSSYTEGNPNNVIQAMAKGIRPLVHIWPGAIEQFPEEYLFATASEAAKMIQQKAYNSGQYRAYAMEHFGLSNIERVVDIALAASLVPA